MEDQSSGSGNTLKVLFGILLLLLLGGLGILGKKYMDQKKEIEEQTFNITDLNTEIEDLETNMTEMQDIVTNKDLEIEEKNRLLAEQESQVKAKQSRINSLYAANKISKEEMEEMKAKIDQLNYYIKKYQGEIAELTLQVDSLKTENIDLGKNVATLKDKNFEIERENSLQKTKIEAAMILKAFNFEYFKVKPSGKKIMDTEFKGGRLDMLEICFKLMENTIAKTGQRDIYIVVIDPKGKVVKDVATQSGYFNFEGKEKEYSVKKQITYARSTKNVCTQYKVTDGKMLVKGRYSTQVYCDGYPIGNHSFLVK